MKASFFALLILLLPLIYGCEGQMKDSENIDISYTLIDSVSPMRVILRVNKELLYAEWTINDSIFVENSGFSAVELILDKPGVNHIDLVASGHDNVRFNGSIDIDVPGAASKLIIGGFYFKNNIKLPIDRDSVQVIIYHNNDIDNPQHVRLFSTSEFLGQDTIIFRTPIVLNVFNCVDIRDAQMSHVYLLVEDVPIYNLDDLPVGFKDGTLSGTIHKRYFGSNVNIFDAYWESLLFPFPQIQMFGNPDPMKEARLLVNWR